MKIPLAFLPITLQTYSICLILIFIPINLAICSIFLYVILGILGLPIFAGASSGINIILGYSGGYIIGFLLAAIFIFTVRKRKTLLLNNSYIFIYSLAIHAIIITPGFIWLGILKGYNIGFYNGLLPLLIPALIKSLAVLVTYKLYKV
jgi:biotin transport system substrate-specific component